nr:MAG TPA: hypothetical protein [Caudoviricetes sp.]
MFKIKPSVCLQTLACQRWFCRFSLGCCYTFDTGALLVPYAKFFWGVRSV